jgi:hypothetical protein
MLVTITTTVAGPDYAYSQGEVVNVATEEAIALVRCGSAKPMDVGEYYKAVDDLRGGDVYDAPRTAEAVDKGRKATRKNK